MRFQPLPTRCYLHACVGVSLRLAARRIGNLCQSVPVKALNDDGAVLDAEYPQNLMAGILRLSLKAEVVVRLDQARRVTPTTTRRCPPCTVVSRASTPCWWMLLWTRLFARIATFRPPG
jgi:hypothetical protein